MIITADLFILASIYLYHIVCVNHVFKLISAGDDEIVEIILLIHKTFGLLQKKIVAQRNNLHHLKGEDLVFIFCVTYCESITTLTTFTSPG